MDIALISHPPKIMVRSPVVDIPPKGILPNSVIVFAVVIEFF